MNTQAQNKQILADALEQRLIDFSVRIIKVVSGLPKSPVGSHIGLQLARSGTAPAPNYAEARGAESQADFAHKLSLVLKELNEACVWLKMIKQAELIGSPERLDDLILENKELCRIFTSSIKTARGKYVESKDRRIAK